MYKECYGLTVPKLLEKAAKNQPNKEVIYDRTRRMSYQELLDESNALASSLMELGIEKGDRVAVSLPNWHEFVVAYFAIGRLGAIMVPFNTRYQQDEVIYILQNAEVKAAFFPKEFGGVQHSSLFNTAKKECPALEHLIGVRFEDDNVLSYERLVEEGSSKACTPIDIDKEDVFSILYTSGTTGKPKGAMLTHNNIVHTGTLSHEHMKCSTDDILLVAVPLFHVFGMVPSVISTIASESKMVLMDVYKAEEALHLIQSEKITIHHGVPTMFILELNHPNFTNYDTSTLRTGIIAAAPCPVEIVKRIRTEMGCDITVAYGLTETSPNLTMTDAEDSDQLRSETVGKPLPGAEVRVVNDLNVPVPFGEVGELVCKSFGVMKGYFKMPEKTREAIDVEGWFHTGDLATIDEQGYVRIVGRKKEMIIRGGYNIYPREIEEYLYTHPAVQEVAIVGLPDTVLGEIVCACIRLKDGKQVTIDELKAFTSEKVADYKVPDKFLFVDQLPMTASGKIQKMKLQENLKKELEAELR